MPEPFYAKLTIERTEPNPGGVPVDWTPSGDVRLRLRDLAGDEILIQLSLTAWSLALKLATPVTCWVTPPKEELPDGA